MGQFEFLIRFCIIECSFEIKPNVVFSWGHVKESPLFWYVNYVHWQGKVRCTTSYSLVINTPHLHKGFNFHPTTRVLSNHTCNGLKVETWSTKWININAYTTYQSKYESICPNRAHGFAPLEDKTIVQVKEWDC